ncbi:MAG: hypothetical protein RXS42_09310 [Nitrososphaeria archaeon]
MYPSPGVLELAAPSREATRASGRGILGDLARDGHETHMCSANTMFAMPRYGFGPFDEVLLVPYFAPTALSSEEELEDFLSSSFPSPRRRASWGASSGTSGRFPRGASGSGWASGWTRDPGYSSIA